jgi:hypothetical protein
MPLAASSVHKQPKKMNEDETDAVGCVLRAGKVYKVFRAEA